MNESAQTPSPADLLEQCLHFPFEGKKPPPGSSTELVPHVRWVRMPLPFTLDHINLWLIRDQREGPEGVIDGWAVVDCCVSTEEAKQYWQQVFDTQLEGLPVLRVIVTHMHPDHVGLAHWLCQQWSTSDHTCQLWMSATDHHLALLYSQGMNAFGGEDAANFFSLHGWRDEESLSRISARESYYQNMVPKVPRVFVRLMHDHVLRIGKHNWRCIAGFGHAPEHMSLYCESLGILISGDMVLPRISTNVSVYEIEPEADALTLFLRSLELFLPLPKKTLVLPSHGQPFIGLHERIVQLNDHHRERLAELLLACEGSPKSAHDILSLLFKRPLDFQQTTFAMGEALAHLHRLWVQGQLDRILDDKGIYRFAAKKVNQPAVLL
jgi:glyoxylase-like metal-dependent hydrolase (beta-lactamase superfamily II)